MMMGTRCFTHNATSCSKRSLLPWTIWLTANGATMDAGLARRCAASSAVISASQSSSCAAGRALSAGNEPTMPALHCASTRRGVDTMNIGAPITGSRRRPCRISGMGITAPQRVGSLKCFCHYGVRRTRSGIIMQYDTLLFERRDTIAHVSLNRPDRLNALNRALITDLTAAAAAIDSERGIRAVVLTAVGRAFCSGADLMGGDLLGNPERSPGANIAARLPEYFPPMVNAWFQLRVPVVVAVNGIAAGAGVSLALVGDIVVAARSATFLQLFAPKLGLMPDLGSTFHLPRLVGTARAKGLALLGDP